MIDDIAELLKFDYEIVEAPDAKFGNMDEKGNWNGVVKELMDKRADIGLGSMSVMAERENVIDFTVPYYDLVGITILMKLPETPTSLFKFLTVLETDVWLCILAAYFFTRYCCLKIFYFSIFAFPCFTVFLCGFSIAGVHTVIKTIAKSIKMTKKNVNLI